MQVDAKTYLEEIERYEEYIKDRTAEIYRLECLATSVTAALCDDKVQTSGTSDKVGNIVAMIVDEQDRLQESVKHFFYEKKERIALVEKLDNLLEYKVIHGKYIKYLDLKDIAENEGYTHQYICDVHTKALKNFQKILNNLYKPIES